jgi:hypothetical protein
LKQIDKADFEAWRADPITQALFQKLERIAENAKRSWLDISFAGNVERIDIALLSKLRAHRSLCLQILNMSNTDLENNEDRKP